MKKRIMTLIGIVIAWGFLLWYLNACGISKSTQTFSLVVCGISLLIVLNILFRKEEEDKAR